MSETTLAGRPVVAVLNGPNLNLLGLREPALYGHETLADVEALCRQAAGRGGCVVDFRQSNHEGVLVDWVHELRASVAGIVVNAGGYTHTSIALRDALLTVTAPVVEVHLTNVHAREDFRHRSLLADVAAAVVAGLGPAGYAAAVEYVAARAGHAARQAVPA
jgi:3-dehydroquinate dehydratase II